MFVRPDERQARALIQHARPNHKTGITHTEGERAVHSRQCAYLKRHILTDVIDDPHVTRRILRVDALTHDAA